MVYKNICRNFIAEFKKIKVMFKKLFQYTPTAQEQQFIDIIAKLLDHPKTSLKMTPLTDKYFLINEQKTLLYTSTKLRSTVNKLKVFFL